MAWLLKEGEKEGRKDRRQEGRKESDKEGRKEGRKERVSKIIPIIQLLRASQVSVNLPCGPATPLIPSVPWNIFTEFPTAPHLIVAPNVSCCTLQLVPVVVD